MRPSSVDIVDVDQTVYIPPVDLFSVSLPFKTRWQRAQAGKSRCSTIELLATEELKLKAAAAEIL